MPIFRRSVSYRSLTIRESPAVYPIQPEVPEAIDRLLVEFHLADAPLRILEIGTGTGIIACALAAAGHAVVAVDLLPGAVSLAHDNATDNGLQVEFAVSDLCDAVTGTFDRIVFNVPNTIAVTRWGTFIQYLGARLLPKPIVESVGYILSRWIVRNAAEKHAFYKRLLQEVRSHLHSNGELVLLVPSSEVDLVSKNPAVATARIEALQAATGVRLVFLTLASAGPGRVVDSVDAIPRFSSSNVSQSSVH